MNKTITVSVTQKNIDEGSGYANSCSRCPVALALRDCGDQYSYLVNCAALYNIHNERVAYLPAEAIRFINDFDHGHDVAPFTFNVSFLN
jgi:hypothetical protein